MLRGCVIKHQHVHSSCRKYVLHMKNLTPSNVCVLPLHSSHFPALSVRSKTKTETADDGLPKLNNRRASSSGKPRASDPNQTLVSTEAWCSENRPNQRLTWTPDKGIEKHKAYRQQFLSRIHHKPPRPYSLLKAARND